MDESRLVAYNGLVAFTGLSLIAVLLARKKRFGLTWLVLAEIAIIDYFVLFVIDVLVQNR